MSGRQIIKPGRGYALLALALLVSGLLSMHFDYFVAWLLLVAGLAVVAWMLWNGQRNNQRVIVELRQGRQQLREAQRLAQIGSWELEIPSGRLTWSEELYRIFGIDPQAGPGDYQRFLQMVPAEDRERVDEAYRASFREREPQEVEHRLITGNGQLKQIRSRWETHFDEQGNPLRTIGTAQDITDLRRMESQMQLLGTAFHHSGEAILIT